MVSVTGWTWFKPNVIMSKITDKLYLGNAEDAMNRRFLQQIRCTVLINCTKGYPNDSSIPIQIRIPVDDDLQPKSKSDMTQYLIMLVPRIEQYINNGNVVFVHCYAGMQRSAIVVLSYLVYHQYHRCIHDKHMICPREYLFTAVLEYLRMKRPLVFAYGSSINFKDSFDDFCKYYGI